MCVCLWHLPAPPLDPVAPLVPCRLHYAFLLLLLLAAALRAAAAPEVEPPSHRLPTSFAPVSGLVWTLDRPSSHAATPEEDTHSGPGATGPCGSSVTGSTFFIFIYLFFRFPFFFFFFLNSYNLGGRGGHALPLVSGEHTRKEDKKVKRQKKKEEEGGGRGGGGADLLTDSDFTCRCSTRPRLWAMGTTAVDPTRCVRTGWITPSAAPR